MFKINYLKIFAVLIAICAYNGLAVPNSMATVTFEYNVKLDSPPEQAEFVDVSLAIRGNTDPTMYFIFCWYNNKMYRQNITRELSEDIDLIEAVGEDGTVLQTRLLKDREDIGEQFEWQSGWRWFWEVETNGASSFTIFYRKKFDYESALFLIPVSHTVNQSDVTFEVPFDYKVITPWKKTSENSFVVNNTIPRSWLANLVNTDIYCILSDYPVTKFTVDGIGIEFIGETFHDNAFRYQCDVFKYLKQIHGGYEHERFILYAGVLNTPPVIKFTRSYNGGTNQGFPDPFKEYKNPLDFVMDTYQAGYKKFGKFNSSPFHEWGHHWNVTVLRSEEDSGKWYHDGISNYFEAIGPRDIWNLNVIYEAQLYQSWDYYKKNIRSPLNQPLYELVPFDEEGFVKEIALMVYSKGMIFYYMLDKEFQNRGKNFSDFAKLLYSTFNSDNPGTVHDFIDLANTYAGDNLSAFMDKYLLGNEDYPLNELNAFRRSYYSIFGKIPIPWISLLLLND